MGCPSLLMEVVGSPLEGAICDCLGSGWLLLGKRSRSRFERTGSG